MRAQSDSSETEEVLKTTGVVEAGSTRIVDESQLKLYARASVTAFETSAANAHATRVVSEAEMRRTARMSVARVPAEVFEDEPATTIDAPEHDDDGTTNMPSTGVVAKSAPSEWHGDGTTDIARTAPRAKSPVEPSRAKSPAEASRAKPSDASRARSPRSDPAREYATVPTPLAASRRSKQRAMIVPVCIDHDLAPTNDAALSYERAASIASSRKPSRERAHAREVALGSYAPASNESLRAKPRAKPPAEAPVDPAPYRSRPRAAWVGPELDPAHAFEDPDDIEVPCEPAVSYEPQVARPAPACLAPAPASPEPVLLLRAKKPSAAPPLAPAPVAYPAPIVLARTKAPSAAPNPAPPSSAISGPIAGPIVVRPSRHARLGIKHLLVGLVIVVSLGGIAMGATYLLFHRDDQGSKAKAFSSPPRSETVAARREPRRAAAEPSKPTVEPIRMPVVTPVGTVRFHVEPEDARVRIDGVEKERGAAIELGLGRHDVQIARRGYRSWQKTIDVASAETVVWVALRKKQRPEVKVASAPSESGKVTPERGDEVEPAAPVTVERRADEVVEQSDDDEDPLASMR